ncbi:MAG: PQQ-binding-like beta-propeller repeat protein [Myxococcaceae bacterium]
MGLLKRACAGCLCALVLAGCPAATVGGTTPDGGSPDGGGTPDGGTPDSGPPDGGGTPDGGGNQDAGTLPDGGAVLAITTFGVHGSRDSLYVDSAFTKARLSAIALDGGLKPDPAFTPAVVGDVYASPLFLEAGLNGKDVLFVATEENNVYAIDAAAGTVLWSTPLGPGVPLSQFTCGNINTLGITSTPVLDVARRELVVVGTLDVPANSQTPHHIVYGLSIDTGAVLWSIDVDATLGSTGFDTKVQGQRASLLLLNDVVYIPFGGYYGDCGTNWGYVMAVPLSNPTPGGVFFYQTPGQGGAIWGPSGIATEGTSVFAVTGNGEGNQPTWASGDSDALLRLTVGANSLTFSGLPADFFAFANWQELSGSDADFGSNGTVLFELSGAGSGQLALCIGKSHDGWLVDRANLGGFYDGGTYPPLAHLANIASDDASGGMASYQTPSGRYVVYDAPCDGSGNTLGALKVTPGSPPTLSQAFCVSQGVSGADTGGSPIVTTSDGTNDAVVWGMGAYGDSKLYAVDGDTGALLVNSTAMTNVIHWVAPLVAKGSLYVPVNGRVYAFRVQ